MKKKWILFGLGAVILTGGALAYNVYKKKKQGLVESDTEKETISSSEESAPTPAPSSTAPKAKTQTKASAKIATTKVSVKKPASDEYKKWTPGTNLYASKNLKTSKKSFKAGTLMGRFISTVAVKGKELHVKIDTGEGSKPIVTPVSSVKSSNK